MGSGGYGGGSRFDPPDNVRPLQRALWLKELADFPQGAMHDRVDDKGAEERGFELLSFLELFGAATISNMRSSLPRPRRKLS